MNYRLTDVITRMNLEIPVPSKRRTRETVCAAPSDPRRGRRTDGGGGRAVRGAGGGDGGRDLRGSMAALGVMSVLALVVTVVQANTYVKTDQTAHLKYCDPTRPMNRASTKPVSEPLPKAGPWRQPTLTVFSPECTERLREHLRSHLCLCRCARLPVQNLSWQPRIFTGQARANSQEKARP